MHRNGAQFAAEHINGDRMTFSARSLRIVVALAVAVALAFLSVGIERVGPEQAQYGNLCGPQAASPCYEPVLKGGFPIAFLFDAPGVSVERQLGFGEDELHAGALVADIAGYFALGLLAMSLYSRSRSAGNPARTGAESD
jgi:hypothetical protein